MNDYYYTVRIQASSQEEADVVLSDLLGTIRETAAWPRPRKGSK